MFKVQTKLRHLLFKGVKLNENDFFLINDKDNLERNWAWFDGTPLMYIPGYIKMIAYGNELTTSADWDYPFYMWQNIFNNVEGLVNGEGMEIAFLESPQKYIFERNGPDYFLFYLEINDKSKAKTIIPKTEVIDGFFSSAIEVFNCIETVDPILGEASMKFINELSASK